MDNDLYEYISIWKNKPYYDDLLTLVDMTYDLKSRYESNSIGSNDIDLSVRRNFKGLKQAQKDASEGYCPGTSLKETVDGVFAHLVFMEKFLYYKISRKSNI